MSSKTETRITNPKLVSSCWVNTVVCVRKPGPIEEFAIKKAAPNPAPPKNLNLDGFNVNVILF